jgi:hypothetical protein
VCEVVADFNIRTPVVMGLGLFGGLWPSKACKLMNRTRVGNEEHVFLADGWTSTQQPQ